MSHSSLTRLSSLSLQDTHPLRPTMAVFLARLPRAAAAAAAGSRGFSAAAAAPSIDWSAVRSKMMTDETRAEADRAREAFEKR